MFVLFGLIFLIAKITILSFLYATVSLILYKIVRRKPQDKWYSLRSVFKTLSWRITAIVYGTLLLIYSFSYWGHAGLGDSFRIPIGNGYDVQSIDDCKLGWFEDEQKQNGRQAFLKNFIIRNHSLCSEFQGFNSTDCQDCYLVFDIRNRKMTIFHSENEYSEYAAKYQLPLKNEFNSFENNYYDYWGGWRFWLLP